MVATTCTAMMILTAVLIGCSNKPVAAPPLAAPPPTYTGPAFLHGTVGSLTQLRGYKPLLVSGYGLVVNLQATGSSDVPAYLKQWLINEMRKKGLGSARLGMPEMAPTNVLASSNTAVVIVQGLIPPGATKGTRFDVLVSALPQTQTTSLQAGQLWTTDLARNGADTQMRFSRQLAQAAGAMYINPFDDKTPTQRQWELQRQAVVLSGGVATADRTLELILNQPSWQRSRLIADRINERFSKDPSDRYDTAVPTTDAMIKLHIPARYASRVDAFLNLISHLYLQRAPNFETQQAQRLAELLLAQPDYRDAIVPAWVTLGKTILPVIRRLYDHPRSPVQLAALNAGTQLQDEAATIHLAKLAQHTDPNLRRQAALFLINLPRSIRGARTLHLLLDDDDQSVRIQAYESLAAINDPIIHRLIIGNKPDLKFVLDLVPAKQPLVYITQTLAPRLVIFNHTLKFNAPFLARMWDNRLMLRSSAEDQPVEVFYQPYGQVQGQSESIEPTVASLAIYLAHKPTMQQPHNGLNLSYSHVVNAVHRLKQQAVVDAPMHVQLNPLAQAIAQAQQSATDLSRPETAPAPSTIYPDN